MEFESHIDECVIQDLMHFRFKCLVFREMVNFSNTINYLVTQMNNETSFKQHNKERFIIVAGVKE